MKPHHKPDFYKHEEWELGSWLSAALEDPKSCEEFKESIRAWFEMLGERATQHPKLCDRPICHHNSACVNDFAAESKKCPHRPESGLEINKRFTEMQAEIHRRIAPYLPKRLQGLVMGEIREVLTREMRATYDASTPNALEADERYQLQMAGICTAALGYWKEGDPVHPDYDTPALRDVAKLYAKYVALRSEVNAEENFHKAAMTYRQSSVEGASAAYVDLVRLAKLLDKDS